MAATAETPVFRYRVEDARSGVAANVVLNPEDVRTARVNFGNAARIVSNNMFEAAEQLIEGVEYLVRWCARQKEEIEVAYVTLHEGATLFLVVRSQVKADFDLTDEMTELTVALREQFPMVNFDTLALPRCSSEAQASFLSDSFHYRLVGE